MIESVVLPADSRIHDRYCIHHLIGGGAMARVYLAEDSETGELCAVKVQQVGGPSMKGRAEALREIALREIEFLSTLSHPSLPRITDDFFEGDCVYMVMEYIEGHNLKTIIEANHGRPLDAATVVNWGIQLCDVLAYLHSQDPPVIFRDVKPSNIIRRPDNTLCLVDFGIARQVREGAAADTMVFGSPGYAPPEQYGHDQTEPRSDIYALGATLHHLLSGRDPSLTPFKWPAIRTLNPRVPLLLERLVMKCLEIELTRRPDSAEAVAKSLRQIQEILERSGSCDLTLPGHGDVPNSSGTGALRWGSQDLPVTTDSGTRELPPPPVFLDERRIAVVQAAEKQSAHPAKVTPESAGFVPLIGPMALQRLFRSLTACAMLVVLLCAAYPFLYDQLAPPPPAIMAPGGDVAAIQSEQRTQSGGASDPQRSGASPAISQQPFQQEYLRAMQRIARYDNLKYVSYVLDILILLAFLGGVLQPKRATRAGMVMAIGGGLGLICLTALTFLPHRVDLFIGVASLECLLLIPAAVLLASPGIPFTADKRTRTKRASSSSYV